MSRREPTAVVQAIEQLIDFLSKFGDSEHLRIVSFRDFARRIEREGITRQLFREISRANDDVCSQMDEQIWAGRTLPGRDQDQTLRELRARSGAVNNVLFPIEAEPPELDLGRFAGSEFVEYKMVRCRGDASGARDVIERSVAFVQRYSQALVRGDIAAAYAMGDSALRAAMSFNQFAKLHVEGEGKCRGPLLEYKIERFAYVITDDEARRASNTAKEGWLKATAKENRRSRVVGYWIRDRVAGTICRGGLWLSEELGEDRLANFSLLSD